MLFLAGAGHGYCKKRQKWTRRYLLSTAVSSKKGDFNTPSVFSFFQKENGGLKFVISKPPQIFIGHGESAATRRFFSFAVVRQIVFVFRFIPKTLDYYGIQSFLLRQPCQGYAVIH